MKELGKCRAVIALLCFTATVFSGCGNRTEAVITDGEDITTVSAEYPTLEESHADIFTYKDLKIGNISYLMTESQVIEILGKPKEETENDGEKIYSYNEMSIGFEKLDDNNRPSGSGVYKVTQAASIGSDDKFSRNMRVGQSADDITYGKLLYGDFTIAELDKVNTKETVAYGLVNYNGYSNLETADSYNIEFTYVDGKYKGDRATVDDDFATLNFEIDNNGKITAISWGYYPEQN